MFDRFHAQAILAYPQASQGGVQQFSLNNLPNGYQSISTQVSVPLKNNEFLPKNLDVQQIQQILVKSQEQQQQQQQQSQILIQSQHQQQYLYQQLMNNIHLNQASQLLQVQKQININNFQPTVVQGNFLLTNNQPQQFHQINQYLNPSALLNPDKDQYKLALLTELFSLEQQHQLQQQQEQNATLNQQKLAENIILKQQQLLPTQPQLQIPHQLQHPKVQTHSQPQQPSKLMSPILFSSTYSTNETAQFSSSYPQHFYEALDSKTASQNVSQSGGSPHALDEIKTTIASGQKSIKDFQEREEAEKKRQERLLKIERYKNKRRNWLRKISYDCRKKVADSRLRIKGRFISKKDTLKIKELVGENHDAFNEKKNLRLDFMSSKMHVQDMFFNPANSKDEILFQIEKLIRKNLEIHSQQTMNSVLKRIQTKQQIFCLLKRGEAEMVTMGMASKYRQESEFSQVNSDSF